MLSSKNRIPKGIPSSRHQPYVKRTIGYGRKDFRNLLCSNISKPQRLICDCVNCCACGNASKHPYTFCKKNVYAMMAQPSADQIIAPSKFETTIANSVKHIVKLKGPENFSMWMPEMRRYLNEIGKIEALKCDDVDINLCNIIIHTIHPRFIGIVTAEDSTPKIPKLLWSNIFDLCAAQGIAAHEIIMDEFRELKMLDSDGYNHNEYVAKLCDIKTRYNMACELHSELKDIITVDVLIKQIKYSLNSYYYTFKKNDDEKLDVSGQPIKIAWPKFMSSLNAYAAKMQRIDGVPKQHLSHLANSVKKPFLNNNNKTSNIANISKKKVNKNNFKPSNNYAGCLCCGSKDHMATNCPTNFFNKKSFSANVALSDNNQIEIDSNTFQFNDIDEINEIVKSTGYDIHEIHNIHVNKDVILENEEVLTNNFYINNINNNTFFRTSLCLKAVANKQKQIRSETKIVRFICDSGSSKTLINNKLLFTTYKLLKNVILINTASNKHIFATHSGSIYIKTLKNNVIIHLKDVLYVPNLPIPLLSISALDKSLYIYKYI